MDHMFAARTLLSLDVGALNEVTLGKGSCLVYPLPRNPTHPGRALGSSARGNMADGFFLHTYHGLTSM